MKNINFLNDDKLDKKIIIDLKKFQNEDKNNRITILPDAHLKRGEMLARKAYDDEVSRAPDPRTRSNRKMGGKITKRPMGGKVYKVDNSGQDLVQKMYGGKIKK